MARGHLKVDDFFSRLAELFDSTQKIDHGSVFLVQKRMSYDNFEPAEDGSTDQEGYFADLKPKSPLPILIRATNGASKDKKTTKVKLSTVVEQDQLERFYVRYGEICKIGMHGLKKRDRSGRKKKKGRKEHDGEKKA